MKVATIVLLSFSAVACAGSRHARLPAVPSEPNGGRAPAFSPDGTRIAFLSSTPHTPADVWVMNADGSGKARLTSRGASSFRWAADGAALHVVARRKGYEEVLSVPLAGGREERVPGLPPNASLPVFSPRGALFAFTAPDAAGLRDLWIGTADRSRVESVTQKIHVRSFFWAPDGRKLYYEPGKTYGLGVWELDLATMATRPLVSKYVGTPAFSPLSGRIAYPYPTNPGEFEVHTMNLDGGGAASVKAPGLGERWLAWAPDGAGVFYLGRAPAQGARDGAAKPSGAESTPAHAEAKPGGPEEGAISLWHLDLATGTERRVSPGDLHVTDFSIAPDGRTAAVAGLLPSSPAPEIFRIEIASGEAARLATSRPSAWMPVPSPDASRVAYVTNEGTLDAVRVVDLAGEEKAVYPGFLMEGDAKLFWLPRSDGLFVFSGRGLHAFSEGGAIPFPGAKDHRALLHADVSVQEDAVALSAVPRYGEQPALYRLQAVDGTLVQTDLTSLDEGPGRYLQPRWSLDGKRLAFTDGIDVWTMNADRSGVRRLTAYAEGNAAAGGPQAAASLPVWSVRGDRLAYTRTVYDAAKVVREIWVVEADGSSPRRLYAEEMDSQLQAFLPEYTSAPFFDPADRHLIATAVRNGVPDVVSIDLASGKATVLTEGGAVLPAMLPEEDAILYTALDGNEERIWIMGADGTGKRPFRKPGAAHGGDDGAPASAAR